jgi:hypothetical protein
MEQTNENPSRRVAKDSLRVDRDTRLYSVYLPTFHMPVRCTRKPVPRDQPVPTVGDTSIAFGLAKRTITKTEVQV